MLKSVADSLAEFPGMFGNFVNPKVKTKLESLVEGSATMHGRADDGRDRADAQGQRIGRHHRRRQRHHRHQ
ncbi:MAG: hypothetical protein B7Z22_14585, partial [Hyphomonas sp. 32-62-5]